MTPAAVTPAARTRPRAASTRAGKGTAHPRPARARAAPAAPRRVSGPARPKRPVRAQPARESNASLQDRAAEFVRGLPDHPLLDRLVRGRAWIPVLGIMLAGIVAMQVEVLKLGASMGRSIALASSLQTRNELLRTTVSSLSDARRIERLAAHMGMVMPGPTSVDFLHGRANAARAAASIHTPDASMFDSALQASALQAAAATTPAPATSTPSSATATTPTVSTPTVSSTTTTAAPTTSTTTSTSSGAAVTGTTSAAGATGATGATTTPSVTSSSPATGGAASGG